MASNAELIGFVLRTSATLVVLIWIIKRFIITTEVGYFRQRLFAIRRDMFMYAAKGNVSFSSPAYRRLEKMINGMLRFAEHASFVRGMMYHSSFHKMASQIDKDTTEMIDAIDSDSSRKEMLNFRSKIVDATAWHIIKMSPIAWFCICTILVLLPFKIISAIVRTMFTCKIDLLNPHRVAEFVKLRTEAISTPAAYGVESEAFEAEMALAG